MEPKKADKKECTCGINPETCQYDGGPMIGHDGRLGFDEHFTPDGDWEGLRV